MSNSRILGALALLAGLLAVSIAQAVTPEQLNALAFGENDAKVQTIAAIVSAGDAEAMPLLQALVESRVQISPEQKRIFILQADGGVLDAKTGQSVDPLPDDVEEVVMNNRMRRELANAMAALQLFSPDPATRLASARSLQGGAGPAMLPLIEKAYAAESEAQIKQLLGLTRATLQLASADAEVRLAAVKTLGESSDPTTKTLLLKVLAKNGEVYAEPDEKVRVQAALSLDSVQGRLAWGERLGQIFSGISLGSILLLAALGLAITYGLMGVINMAHGELIMIGAYATYLVQGLFQKYLPELFNWYLVAALPVAFVIAALVGMVMERTVIRFLYGRPLETLLATWGISLVLIQLVRTIFGAQNVGVENPVWMSGGVQAMSNLVLPYNRIVIIFFAAFVLLGVWLLLTRTRLGLFVRGVTQNRAMAGCVGVPTARVDTYAFGLGSGIAGLAGCALSQIGNVGPDLGQSYIVDSFMVVVLGGVGQLAGTVYAAMGLGIANKFLEGWAGAVLAKIAVLVFIIIFIQKRPQGLFALKGRFADA
ncbi:MAG TPA: urea ABC transporter permease subunit UrtB [Burkholderiales bacterium]|nr:urea ABC transporter permease subunit UrtB [Burkholderiales bacterium]